jgi:hypothetical protein
MGRRATAVRFAMRVYWANPVMAQESLGQAHGQKLNLAFIKLHSDTRRVISNETIISLISTKVTFSRK